MIAKYVELLDPFSKLVFKIFKMILVIIWNKKSYRGSKSIMYFFEYLHNYFHFFLVKLYDKIGNSERVKR